MRKFSLFLALVLLFAALGLPVLAVTQASRVDNRSAVASDGTCQVSLSVTLHLEQPVDDLTFPIPGDARDVTLGTGAARMTREGSFLEVELGEMVAGDFSFTIFYTLPAVVSQNTVGQSVLTLPLLCGFRYGVEAMSFTVTLPGDVTEKPAFTSTYDQATIEQSLAVTVSGSQITGQVTKALNDRDSLSMTLVVPQEMFQLEEPIVITTQWTTLAMTIAAVVALVYWLVFLRCLPPRGQRTTTAPDGLTAGDLGPVLTAVGTDLTLMVLSWAQLGYILIHLDDNGRVILHKRMEMGNERSAYENRIFRELFGRRRLIDGTGYHYAMLCRKVAGDKPRIHGLYRRRSGNPRLFRLLASLVGLFGGLGIAIDLAGLSPLRVPIMVLGVGLGLVSAWCIQSGCRYWHLRRGRSFFLGLGCCLLWLLAGAAAGQSLNGLIVVLLELLAGFAGAYGGQRTEMGMQMMSQVLGLRRYLKTASRDDLRRILGENPEYYYTLAPYALALGVDNAFARCFGSLRLTACPYMTSGMDGHMTAWEWSRFLRRAAQTLDQRQQMWLERILGK